MLKNLFKSIYLKVISSYILKKKFYSLLSSPFFINNPFYRYLFYKDIHKKISILKEKPSAVIIENTNFCNISCVFCANESMQRIKGFIDERLFEKIIDQCASYKISTVLIQGFGEPLLDKTYVSKVAYAKQKGIANVYCVTNGILLDKDVSESLIKSRLDHLSISLDAASDQIYGNIHRMPKTDMPCDKFSNVIENIEGLINLKKRYGVKSPVIEVRFKDFDKNKSDLAQFIKKYKGKVDKVTIYMNITNWPASNIKNNLPKKKFLKFPCYNPWSTLFITYDGRVALCCQDYECRIPIGDVNKEDIIDIWNTPRMNEIRKLHLEDKFDQINICRDCVINTHYVTPWWP